MVTIPRDQWTESFAAAGMPAGRTGPREEMVDGFNSGLIEFEGAAIKGETNLDEAIRRMLHRS